jgi:hypothetical protein
MAWQDHIAPPIHDPGRLEPAHLWVIGLTPGDTSSARTLRGRGTKRARLAMRDDCRCPDDCSRDHPNE